MFKKLFGIVLLGFALLSTAYLTIPLPPGFYSNKQEFPFEEPVLLVRNSLNKGQRCKENTVYVTNSMKYVVENEGFKFIVNDYCANLQEDLVKAISEKNIEKIRKLLSQGANPNTPDFSNYQAVSPLIVATYQNSEIVKLLLDNGADVNEEYCCCASCQSPLTSAISGGDSRMVKLLLERGANVEYKPELSDPTGVDVFDIALEHPNQEIWAMLDNACESSVKCRLKFRAKRILKVF